MMRITKQSSGERGVKGRGEYELCDHAPNGLWPSDLVGLCIRLRLGAYEFDTGVQVTKAQAKYRLRVAGSEKRNMQVTAQVASALLMPPVARGEDKMFGGEVVLRNKAYVIKNIVFDSVEHIAGEAYFTASVCMVECDNRTVAAEQVHVMDRLRLIERLWTSRECLPAFVASLLDEHQRAVCAGTPIPASARALIRQLQSQTERLSASRGLYFARTTDVLPSLIALLASPPGADVSSPEFSSGNGAAGL